MLSKQFRFFFIFLGLFCLVYSFSFCEERSDAIPEKRLKFNQDSVMATVEKIKADSMLCETVYQEVLATLKQQGLERVFQVVMDNFEKEYQLDEADCVIGLTYLRFEVNKYQNRVHLKDEDYMPMFHENVNDKEVRQEAIR